MRKYLFVLVAMTAFISGCSKKRMVEFAQKPKVIGAAMLVGVATAAHFIGDVFGVRKRRRNNRVPSMAERAVAKAVAKAVALDKAVDLEVKVKKED